MAVKAPTEASSSQISIIDRVLKVDTEISQQLHAFFYPLVPSFLHLILEISADFRLFMPLALAMTFSPWCAPFISILSPLILGLIMDLLVVGLAKVIFRRRRPPYNPSMSAAVPVDHYSFPSGHSTRVFFVASLVFLSFSSICAALPRYREWITPGNEEYVAKIATTLCCAWAGLTASSRVLLGRHYSLDVVVGSVLGVFEGLVAFHFLNFEDYFAKIVLSVWEFFPVKGAG